jgi:hypothetical protein
MTLYEYKLLSETEQKVMLWERGVYLSERYDLQHCIGLYQIEGFYVEVFYAREQNTIRRIRSFKSVDQLRPYLGKIDLSQLL